MAQDFDANPDLGKALNLLKAAFKRRFAGASVGECPFEIRSLGKLAERPQVRIVDFAELSGKTITHLVHFIEHRA